MLIVNDSYKSLHTIINSINETLCSDRFESKCARYLRKNYPEHKFSVRGGNNNTVSDILVDDKFYIECKMTENGDSKSGAQSTGFGIKLVDENTNPHFECSDTAINNTAASKMLEYINSNLDQFIKITKPHSSTSDLNVDPSIFAEWISNYYSNKNVLFFIVPFNNELAIFKNTPANLLKYFNISATARYYSNGSKNLPICQRENVIAALKKVFADLDVYYDNNHTIIKTSSEIDSPYFDAPGIKVYLSTKHQKPNEYRLMKLPGLGSPRILFSLYSKRGPDSCDISEFERYINSK